MGAAATNVSAKATIASINPATGQPIGEVPDQSAQDIRGAIETARRAQQAWAAIPIEIRCRQVGRFADMLMERAEDVIDLLVREGGKTRQEALGMEVVVVADLVRFFAKHAPRM